ncbi:MAG: hypothetical protein B7Y43_07105 [Sphingomonas sp. 28-62-20]|uniref:ornithine cyclodeaminase family protein n=1 Tax=Sphingomonas sp. 28-62-20 TaxID=1970433 RepID=UPI000BD80C55|nr:MAG: hypothetical protein B7Y43_07105 [Sphingomonas sp. 28-62-20]
MEHSAPPSLVVVNEEEASRLLTPQLAYRAVERALAALADGSGSLNPVVIGAGLMQGQSFSIKSGAAGDERLVGLKVGSYWPGAETHGLARHGSSIFLLDAETGRLRAIVEASRLNGPRTAAADAVVASFLARADCHTLAVIGAGHQAEHEVRALCAVRPIARVLIASRSAERAAALATALLGCAETVMATDAQTACRAADIIVTVTTATAPVIEAEWVGPGTHIASMGSDQRGKHELPVALIERAVLFCDLPAQSLAIGEFQHVAMQVAAGNLSLTAIGDVVRGVSPGRTSAEAITIFDSSGTALQDLYVAQAILDAR